MIHIVVADSRTLRVFEISSVSQAMAEVAVFRNPLAGRHDRDLVSDRPGRVVNRASGARQAYEPKVPAKQHSMQRWLRDLGPALQDLLQTRRSDSMILVAAPRMLVQLKTHLPPTVRKRVCETLRLDLVNRPVADLRLRLQPALRALGRRRSSESRPRQGTRSMFASRGA